MASVLRYSASGPSLWMAPASPDDVERLAREAAIQASHGEYERAIASYRAVLLMDDGRADLWFNFAVLQQRMGQVGDAAEGFEFAVRIDPDLYPARYCLARLLYEQGQPLAAIAHLEQVVQQNPAYAPAWRHLGQIRLAMGDLAQAHDCLRQAISAAS